jgi:PAS domain S-box-containing protein
MLDGLAYGKIMFDGQGHPIDYIYLRVNKNFEQLTGLNNVEGKKVTEVIPEITTSNPDWIEIHHRVASTGIPERFETYIAPLGGWLFVSIYSIQKGFFVSVFQNITARITTEKELEKFKLALDNISDNVIITDPNGIVIYANKAVEKITGYQAEEAVGKKSGALWKTPMPKAYYENMWDTIKTQKKVFVGEIQNRRKNGEVYTAMISISPIFNEDRNVEFFVSIERDITKEKEIDRAKSEFMTLASHQLRTPPSIIGWYTEALQSGDLGPINEKQTDYLAEIYRANKRMVNIINSLLNISRLDMGSFSVAPEAVNIGSNIDEVVKELMARFDRKAKIEKDYDPALNHFAIDPNILGIIAENLISNSFKYSAPENTHIEIAAKKEGDALVLNIKDNGIGIPAAIQDKIFEKLLRADNAASMSPDGTGVGLYMVKKIVTEALGGKIWFQSEENKGTTFFVLIPAAHMEKKIGTSTLVR